MLQRKRYAINSCRLAVLLFAGWFAAGCNSFSPGSTATPSVIGRVLAADTHEPLAGVRVSRVVPGQDTGETPKGAQLLAQGQPAVTDANGNFTVSGREFVTFFRRASSSTERLAFQAPGYALLQTNFPTARFTNQADVAAPVIDVGDVWLKPKAE